MVVGERTREMGREEMGGGGMHVQSSVHNPW